MRRTVIALCLVLFCASPAKAEFEFLPIIGFDAKAIAGKTQGNDSIVGVRLRHTRSLLGLELSANLDHGIGAVVFVDTIRVWRLRFHLDFGVFYPALEQMSVPDVPRKYDLVIGAGVEVALYKKRLTAFLTWRAYLPDLRLAGYYGDFFVPIYKQALKEGAWWFGLGWRI